MFKYQNNITEVLLTDEEFHDEVISLQKYITKYLYTARSLPLQYIYIYTYIYK